MTKYRLTADISSFIGRVMPNFFIRDCRVVFFISSILAAPYSPPTCQLVAWSTFKICCLSFSSRVLIFDHPLVLFLGNQSPFVKRLPEAKITALSIIFFIIPRHFRVSYMQLTDRPLIWMIPWFYALFWLCIFAQNAAFVMLIQNYLNFKE